MVIPPIGGIGAVAPSLPTTPAAPSSPAGGSGNGFGSVLSNAIDKLDQGQQQASAASEQLATGQATDISSVVSQVEEASLSLQLAVQVRNKTVDAYNELFGMQI
jgi:flagellar hook-basal body complex protein FliE